MNKKLTLVLCGIGLVLGFGLGIFMAQSSMFDSSGDLAESLMRAGVIIVGLALSLPFHVIIHEAGHLVLGLATGYGFVSFRVYSMTFVREDGKLRRKRFNIKGTGGQCLLSPPKMGEDGRYPYVWYHLGGVIANAAVSALCIGLALLLNGWGDVVLFLLGMIGLLLAVSNMIPMNIGVPNDGYNVLAMGKSKLVRENIWRQLAVIAETSAGKRYRELPEEWFALPEDNEGQPVYAATHGYLRAAYLLDDGRFAELAALIEPLIAKESALPSVPKLELRCEWVFAMLMTGQGGRTGEQHNKELQNYIKATGSYVSRQRLLYAMARLQEKDDEKAEKYRESFAAVCQTYPNRGEIAGEQALMALVDDMAG